jgi:saccharopepsin
VPSQYCNPSNATYNASASSTYHENGNITRIIYGPSYAWAQLSEDTLTFPGGLQVPKQVFHEIKHYEYVYDYGWGCEFFDGVLGLAADPSFTVPYWWGTPNVLPGQFKSMVDNNVLDTNMFSIVWPTEAREQGTITFGGYDEDLLEGELVPHALFPKNTTLWQVELEGLTLTDHYSNEVLVDTPLPQVRDHFLSFHPIIGLNYYLAQSLLKHMHTWPSACVRYPIVDCDRLPSLPEIVFRFKGQNVTLRGEDYVRKLKTPTNCPDADDACHVMFDYLGSQKDLVLLGTPFLERVMGVFNWDERTDSCEFFCSGRGDWLC